MTFHYANNSTASSPPPSPLIVPFTITAPPQTDIWRKPPHTDIFTAPILYRTFPLATFRRARVTVSAGWKTLYDQGGLFFARPESDGVKKWVKAGVEFFDGRACASVVAAERWADWSLATIEEEGGSVTVEFAREPPPSVVGSGETGTGSKKVPSLWVYLVEGGRRRPIREIKWPFVRDDGVVVGEEEGEECWVGVYAAKPTAEQADPGEGLDVRFGGLTIE